MGENSIMKANCWEFKKCGRQPGGIKVTELGTCPAALDSKLNGINGGAKGGRACWALVGTLCGGKVQGSFAAKMGNCLKCEHFRNVRTEEGENYMKANELVKMLHN